MPTPASRATSQIFLPAFPVSNTELGHYVVSLAARRVLAYAWAIMFSRAVFAAALASWLFVPPARFGEGAMKIVDDGLHLSSPYLEVRVSLERLGLFVVGARRPGARAESGLTHCVRQ